jgi:hypothetical protein
LICLFFSIDFCQEVAKYGQYSAGDLAQETVVRTKIVTRETIEIEESSSARLGGDGRTEAEPSSNWA